MTRGGGQLPTATVHVRSSQAVSAETAAALRDLILAAQRALSSQRGGSAVRGASTHGAE